MSAKSVSPSEPRQVLDAALKDTDEPITLAQVAIRLTGLADLLEDLAEPSERGLTDDLRIQAPSLTYLSNTVRELADRCERDRGAR